MSPLPITHTNQWHEALSDKTEAETVSGEPSFPRRELIKYEQNTNTHYFWRRPGCHAPMTLSPCRLEGQQGRTGDLTDMHVDEVLSVLVDGPPHVSLALLVLVAPLLAAGARAGGGLLLGAVVAPRHHGLVGGFAA